MLKLPRALFYFVISNKKSAVGSKNLRSKQHSAPVHFEFTSQLKLLTIEKKATTESIKKKQASQSHLLSDLTW